MVMVGVAAAALITGGVAAADTTGAPHLATTTGTIYACYSNTTKALSRTTKAAGCKQGFTELSWNAMGLQGPAGPQGPVGPAGPAGSSGVEIDAGVAEAGYVNGNYYCPSEYSVGPDANNIQITAFALSDGITECVIEGFPGAPVLVSINSQNSDSLPQGWYTFSENFGTDCPGPFACAIVAFPDSALQTTGAFTFSWEAMETANPAAMSSAVAKRQQQALRQLAALARPHDH